MTDTVEARWEQHNEAGRRQLGEGDYSGAEQSFVAAIREATLLGADNARLATSLANLGQLKYRQKDLPQAEALFRRSLSIRERVLGPEHGGLVQTINNLAALHFARGNLSQAESEFRRALEIGDRQLGATHPDVAVTLSSLARLYFRNGEFAAAAPLLLRLLAIKEQTLGSGHPEVAAILTSLAKVRTAGGDLESADSFARRALIIREGMQRPNDPALAMSLEVLAEICGARGAGAEQDELLLRARSIREVTGTAPAPAAPRADAAPAPLAVPQESAVPASDPGRRDRTGPLSGDGGSRDRTGPGTARTRPSNPSIARDRSGPSGRPPARPSGDRAGPSAPSPAPTSQGHTGPMPPTAPPVRRSGAVERTGPVGAPRRNSSSAPRPNTLPWIEAPTSPNIQRPRPARASAPDADAPRRTSTPKLTAPSAVPALGNGSTSQDAPHHAPSPAMSSATREGLTRFTPPASPRVSSPRTIQPTPAQLADDDAFIAEQRLAPMRPRHSRGPLVLVIAVLAAAGLGALSWFLFGGSRASDQGTDIVPVSAAPAPASERTPPRAAPPAELPASEPRSTARPVQTPEAASASKVADGTAAKPEQPPHPSAEAVPPSVTPVRHANPAHAATSPQPKGTPLASTKDSARAVTDSAPLPPTINTEGVVSRITQRAKQHVDSLGRTVTVKPPTFGKP